MAVNITVGTGSTLKHILQLKHSTVIVKWQVFTNVRVWVIRHGKIGQIRSY